MKEKRQIVVATLAMVALFTVYEWAKTAIFPDMSVTTSHVITIIVAGVITAIISRQVIKRQSRLIDEQKNSNERLREALATAERSTNLLQSIITSVDEGLIIIDRNQRILLINDAAQSLLNLRRKDFERLPDISRDPPIIEAFLSVLTKGERASTRVEITVGINKRILRLQTAPLRFSDQQVEGVVGAFIDITQLERLESIRQAFLANVSHELRTPLTSITAYTETLLDGGLNDQANSLRFLNTIHRNAERMRNLVNDISELSLIEAGAVQLSFDRLSLHSVVSEVFNGLAPRSEKYQVQLRNEVPEDCSVIADRRRLEQILINLVDNAIKFNKPQGEVIVGASITEEQTIIRVRDSGVGISPEHLSRVFERFYRVDKARSRELGGTGLGLAIVKHLTRAHGGDAEVNSTIGQGCEFIIKLPNRDSLAI
ncbi:MAG: PAS domain-containing protein [Blastocatellia bacterium]|nr:PAS domain-containing protein [Blastocatellia bacterium]